jgi:environmental stress-induced protein Ves
MSFDLIRRADLTVSLWHNRAGRKADIAGGPGWHVGFAMLDADAPFSDFSGQDRTITLVEGPGFTLTFPPAHPPLVEAEPFIPRPFDGGWPTACTIHGGPCVVLNAMTERALYCHSVQIFPPGQLPVLPADTDAPTFLVLLEGTARVTAAGQGTDLGLHDAVRLHGPVQISDAPAARFCMIRILAAD